MITLKISPSAPYSGGRHADWWLPCGALSATILCPSAWSWHGEQYTLKRACRVEQSASIVRDSCRRTGPDHAPVSWMSSSLEVAAGECPPGTAAGAAIGETSRLGCCGLNFSCRPCRPRLRIGGFALTGAPQPVSQSTEASQRQGASNSAHPRLTRDCPLTCASCFHQLRSSSRRCSASARRFRRVEQRIAGLDHQQERVVGHPLVVRELNTG